ncbi:MAG: hypothetical protein A2268_16970 [Candidatus Raymondbacteria bacterium RifOxyA12_full_50_37]|uniref:Uncharacterized protein n=1 Tax=Candidatus Raymondbacteria bacterium RIFOXYD12_FULL_49_13 TaxID=1817890 RepID=A0A1F7FCJ9_UNCRA|nr:MAG: hypothetical protein A2268_16970 [Candidatus Raymondbacteria bacterium RifOxyA12_full_50_37]OGJ86301.1 MAG: hypothetical protein A2248_16570 [Candidatus Raymondbacteria bacterium RIFOXYA2_FULL_49_16]OGK04404.1 MAG: hypothetical protein A2519_18540 [Candidatus Raymondbacteria bacterium RIFOXYD12_FULL_49_13]OGP42754.1 MAG: hypothetical protein A2324_00980 [Candidatus Raymondbacteria bacterium RIFOXYB2_FULL_49_35]
MKYKKILGVFLGPSENLPLENRLFNAVTLCAGIAGAFSSVSDYTAGHNDRLAEKHGPVHYWRSRYNTVYH